MIAPDAEIDDGLLDVMYTNFPLESNGLLKAVFAFLRGSHVSDKRTFTCVRAERVGIETSSECIEAHCDGELFTHKGQKFSIEIRKGALEMIAGKLQSGGK